MLHESVQVDEAEWIRFGVEDGPDAPGREALWSIRGPARSMLVLMGESCPVCEMLIVEDTDMEAELDGMWSIHKGEFGIAIEWLSSESMESMLRQSDHGRSPSSATAGKGQSIARQ